MVEPLLLREPSRRFSLLLVRDGLRSLPPLGTANSTGDVGPASVAVGLPVTGRVAARRVVEGYRLGWAELRGEVSLAGADMVKGEISGWEYMLLERKREEP